MLLASYVHANFTMSRPVDCTGQSLSTGVLALHGEAVAPSTVTCMELARTGAQSDMSPSTVMVLRVGAAAKTRSPKERNRRNPTAFFFICCPNPTSNAI